jgi:hypothetical protein
VGIFVSHHFSASLEPGGCYRRQMHSGKPLVFPAKIGAFGKNRRCCRIVTVTNDHGSGIAPKQPN